MADKYFLVDDALPIHSPWLSSAQNKWMSSRPWVKLITTKEEYIEWFGDWAGGEFSPTVGPRWLGTKGGDVMLYAPATPKSGHVYGIWKIANKDGSEVPNKGKISLAGTKGTFVGAVLAKTPQSKMATTADIIKIEFILPDLNALKYTVDVKNQYYVKGSSHMPRLVLGGTAPAAPAAPTFKLDPEPFKNLCDIILAETIKSYLL
jgi:hypothetical protein